MLGDQIYEGKGKITGTRVLDVDGPKIENSYMVQSKLKGIEVTETGTFTATMRSDGVQYGEDKALIMAQDGSGGTMMAHGIGRQVGADKISFRGLAIMGPANTGNSQCSIVCSWSLKPRLMEITSQSRAGNGSRAK